MSRLQLTQEKGEHNAPAQLQRPERTWERRIHAVSRRLASKAWKSKNKI
jgi:hypothetical protein